MVYLDKMLSGWSAEERKKININWDRIMIGFSNLQDQIRFLAGGEEIDEILQRIEDAITNAKNATNDAITAIGEINSALARLDILITNTNASAQRAETAADDADQMNQILNSLKTELQALQTELNGIVQAEVQRVANETVRVDAEQQRVAAENSRVTTENARETAEQGRIMAETNRKTAEQEREQAEQNRQQKLEELLAVLDHLDFKGEYNPARSYLPFNVVRFGRASYVALLEVSGIQPSDDGVNWRLLAAGGIDGSGAVSTVNGIEPDELGNVKLIIDYINNLTSERVDVGLSAAMGKFLKSLIDALALEKVDAAFVKTEVEALVNAAPGALDTLSELADALGNDPNFATTIIDMLATKASNDQLATTNDNLAQTNNNLTALDTKVTTHLDDDERHLRAGERDKINNALQPNAYWNTTRANLGDSVAERNLGTIIWETNGVTEQAYIVIPLANIFGRLEVTLASAYSHSNAAGGCTVIFDVALASDGEILTNRKTVMSMNEGFANNFFIGDLGYSTGWAFVIPVIKRQHMNHLKVQVKFFAAETPAYDIMTNIFIHKDPPLTQIYQYPIQKDLDTRINELFTLFGDKNRKIASAISDKGVPTNADATGDQMAANIRAIPTGKKTKDFLIPVNLAPGAQQEYTVELGFVPRFSSHQTNGYYLMNGIKFGSPKLDAPSVMDIRVVGTQIILTIRNGFTTQYNHPGTTHYATE